MTNNYFSPDVSPSERLQLLQDNADKIENAKYYVQLTPEELDAKREKLTDNSIRLSEFEDELEEIKVGFKSKMNPLKIENKGLLVEVKTKQQLKSGNLYHIANHNSSMMEIYDSNGELVSSRRLLPEEKQQTIMSVMRPAANQ